MIQVNLNKREQTLVLDAVEHLLEVDLEYMEYDDPDTDKVILTELLDRMKMMIADPELIDDTQT